MTVFFGDSFTSGENNNFKSYVNKLSVNGVAHNLGFSGSTIGDYSLYPVRECLYNLIYEYPDISDMIKNSDTVVLSYGINDISSVVVGYTSLLNVEIDLIKCLDYIKQINPNCNIKFITVSSKRNVLNKIAKSQVLYLEKYFNRTFNYESFISDYVDNFKKFGYIVNRMVDSVFTMFEHPFEYENNLSSDNIHPNDKGCQIISDNLIKQGF